VLSQNSDTLRNEDKWIVSIKDLPEHYLDTDTIVLSLLNETDETIYFSVSLEEKIADVWVSIIPDLFRNERDHHRILNVRLIMPYEEKILHFAISDILKNTPKPFGECRFSYTIKESPFLDRRKLYSNLFLIE